MKTTCCSADTLICDGDTLERPRYFPRQLISDADLTLDQCYFRDKLRRHNRLLHGWGVVCGALVCPQVTCDGGPMEPWKVVVQPGYVLGPYGDEIVIDCPRVVDLRTRGGMGVAGAGGGDTSDPWCSEALVHCEDKGDFYIAVKYLECPTRPVRVQPASCGCDDTACEYSRMRDGYMIGVLRTCPTPNAPAPHKPEWCGDVHGSPSVPSCPPCPTEPWVGLARVSVDTKGMVTHIDNCACRRMVASFGSYSWGCGATAPATAISVEGVAPGKKKVLAIPGSFGSRPKIGFDYGAIHVVSGPTVSAVDGSLTLEVSVDPDARAGTYGFSIVTDDCAVVRGTVVVEGPRPEPCEPEPHEEDATPRRRRRRRRREEHHDG